MFEDLLEHDDTAIEKMAAGWKTFFEKFDFEVALLVVIAFASWLGWFLDRPMWI